MLLNINTIIEPMSMPIFTGILGWSPDAVESLLAEVRKELSDVDSMHAYMTLYRSPAFPISSCITHLQLLTGDRHTVYAQKPRGEHSSGSSIRSSERG